MTQIRFFLFTVLLILIDQLFKYIIRQSGGFYICNPGIAFGIKIPGFLFWIICVIIITFIYYCFFKKTGFKITNYKLQITNKSQIQNSKNKLEKLEIASPRLANLGLRNRKLKIGNYLPIILILAGALSNLIDRLIYGCVIDFIDLKFWPVFNLADVFITIGGIIIAVKILNLKSKILNSK